MSVFLPEGYKEIKKISPLPVKISRKQKYNKNRSVGGHVPPEEHIKRKPAMAASEVAQAEPVFDQRGAIRGEKAEQGRGVATATPRLRLPPENVSIYRYVQKREKNLPLFLGTFQTVKAANRSERCSPFVQALARIERFPRTARGIIEGLPESSPP